MKKIPLLFIYLLIITFSSCEKDDICDASTSTTPKLIIEFYDILNPIVKKNVTNLAVKEINTSSSLVFNGTSKIKIPLKTNLDLTKYSFILNSTDTAIDNEDFLQFNYTRQNLFVSRACGFKTNFTLNPITPFIKTETSTPDGYWIQNVEIITSNITTENEIHVKIYF
ncbi:MAG: hypothetical protein EBR38_02350 [Flavobacteriaceae bacterium]|nr:hypothetical protein [Flavobacteriaceae bacterium]